MSHTILEQPPLHHPEMHKSAFTSPTHDFVHMMFEGADLVSSFWQPLLKSVGRWQLEAAGLSMKQSQAGLRLAHDLARSMINLMGREVRDAAKPDGEIAIEYVGLRPGEKLYEELLADAEETRETPHPKLRIARSRPVSEAFLEELEQWLSQPGPVADEDVRMGLKRWVPEYEPARH